MQIQIDASIYLFKIIRYLIVYTSTLSTTSTQSTTSTSTYIVYAHMSIKRGRLFIFDILSLLSICIF